MLDRYGDEQPAHFDPAAVAGCDCCDDSGYRKPRQGPNDSCAPGVVCNHIDYAAAAQRGMALIRQALSKENK